MPRPSQSRSQTAPPPDASIPRLRSQQPPAHANPCCTACPSHPPDSVAKMESAFRLQENPPDSLFEEFALAAASETKESASPSPRIRLRPKAGFGGQERGEVRKRR